MLKPVALVESWPLPQPYSLEFNSQVASTRENHLAKLIDTGPKSHRSYQYRHLCSAHSYTYRASIIAHHLDTPVPMHYSLAASEKRQHRMPAKRNPESSTRSASNRMCGTPYDQTRIRRPTSILLIGVKLSCKLRVHAVFSIHPSRLRLCMVRMPQSEPTYHVWVRTLQKTTYVLWPWSTHFGVLSSNGI